MTSKTTNNIAVVPKVTATVGLVGFSIAKGFVDTAQCCGSIFLGLEQDTCITNTKTDSFL